MANALLKQFEKLVLRSIINIIIPQFVRVKFVQLKMKIRLHFKPIQCNFIKGDVKIGSNLCVFVSFQPRGIVPTTWKYLKHLKEDLGYSIMLISNCKLQENDIIPLKALCVDVIERSNIGYDFGAYKDGILHYMKKLGNEFNSIESLLIANDSVIAPIHSMVPMHKKMLQEQCDFWGINDAFEHHSPNNLNSISIPHICSYFICFKNSLIKTQDFKAFWQAMEYPSNRKFAIRYEKKVTQYFLNHKYKYSVFIKKEDIIEYIAKNRNSFDDNLFLSQKVFSLGKTSNSYLKIAMAHTNNVCPMFDLTHFGMPAMKRDLIRRDIVNVSIFKAVLNMYENQLTSIVTKEEILEEIGLDSTTHNSIFKWKKYII